MFKNFLGQFSVPLTYFHVLVLINVASSVSYRGLSWSREHFVELSDIYVSALLTSTWSRVILVSAIVTSSCLPLLSTCTLHLAPCSLHLACRACRLPPPADEWAAGFPWRLLTEQLLTLASEQLLKQLRSDSCNSETGLTLLGPCLLHTNHWSPFQLIECCLVWKGALQICLLLSGIRSLLSAHLGPHHLAARISMLIGCLGFNTCGKLQWLAPDKKTQTYYQRSYDLLRQLDKALVSVSE